MTVLHLLSAQKATSVADSQTTELRKPKFSLFGASEGEMTKVQLYQFI